MKSLAQVSKGPFEVVVARVGLFCSGRGQSRPAASTPRARLARVAFTCGRSGAAWRAVGQSEVRLLRDIRSLTLRALSALTLSGTLAQSNQYRSHAHTIKIIIHTVDILA